MTGNQPFVKDAFLNLIYVADYSKVEKPGPKPEVTLDAAVSAGCITQNVYLYCATQGLATVVRRWIDVPPLSKVMGLTPDQEILLSQTVGYPKK